MSDWLLFQSYIKKFKCLTIGFTCKQRQLYSNNRSILFPVCQTAFSVPIETYHPMRSKKKFQITNKKIHYVSFSTLFINRFVFISGVNPLEVSLSGINTVAMWILEHPNQDDSGEDQNKPNYRSEIRIRMDSPVEESLPGTRER